MTLETARLLLRPFSQEDFEDFSVLILDKMSSPMSVYDDPFPTDEEGLHRVLSWFVSTDQFFALELKATHRVIGLASLNRVDDQTRNLGYCIRSDHQGQGYATEAVAAMVEHARALPGVCRLVAGTAQCNTPSVRLLERAGFRLTGESTTSFAKDAEGNPIEFPSFSFEKAL